MRHRSLLLAVATLPPLLASCTLYDPYAPYDGSSYGYLPSYRSAPSYGYLTPHPPAYHPPPSGTWRPPAQARSHAPPPAPPRSATGPSNQHRKRAADSPRAGNGSSNSRRQQQDEAARVKAQAAGR